MYTVDIHSCHGYAFRLSERYFRLFIRRPVYRSVRSASDRGLTLSGTKTHVKQRFLPLTPLLMVSDVLWSPVLPA